MERINTSVIWKKLYTAVTLVTWKEQRNAPGYMTLLLHGQMKNNTGKVRNVQAWFFRVVFNIKPLWDWISSVGIA